MSYLTHLECSRCGQQYPSEEPHALCPCGGPLLARYDLAGLATYWRPADLAGRPWNMWRYRELLPVREEVNIVSLGEGGTPLIRATRLQRELGVGELLVKDEGLNPTGSFKARGAAAGVSRCLELGLGELAMPTAGNAGSAWAAYATRAGLKIHIAMPADTPRVIQTECQAYGAEVITVDGLISDAGQFIGARCREMGWFDVATLKEPYRIEGKKTMGLEVLEELGWQVPDVIVYPTGGGVGLIGMWKAFDEVESIGWIGTQRPRLVAVQAEGCAPIVRAYQAGETVSCFFQDAWTVAAGLRVPKALGDFLVLRAIRETGGTALAVSDEQILAAQRRLAVTEGIFASPEGAAALAAVEKLVESGWIAGEQRVVIYNTGSGLKYTDSLVPAGGTRV
ncbi:MAG: threonine synthase [Bacillota bacterium]